MDTCLTFGNIEEINFTRIHDNIYSVTIKSDIGKDDKILKNTLFESQLCVIDPTLNLKYHKEYLDVPMPSGYKMRTETFEIPMNIKLLLNNELRQFFTITREE